MSWNLMGLAEIAVLLEVSRQRADVIVKSDRTFPDPLAVLSAGRIWDGDTVEEWAKNSSHLERSRKMADYVSAQQTALFHGDLEEPYRFPCFWRSEGGELLVRVREIRIRHEPLLEWVRSEGMLDGNAYWVSKPRWDDRVTADGVLR
jgi:hypothetical protein